MHILNPYPNYPLGAIAYPFAVRKVKGNTFVKATINGAHRLFETAGRVNGFYPIRRELVPVSPEGRAANIEYKVVAEAFEQPV